MLIIERKCPFTGQWNQMEIQLSEIEYDECQRKWEAGAMIQHAFPMLSADEREFINTGITPEQWKKIFG